MKLKIALVFAAVLALIASGCSTGDNPWSGPTGTVKGLVVDEGTGKGIEGVNVVCGSDSAVTNSKGQFQIDMADAGAETVTAAKTGYLGLGKDTKEVTVVENSTVDAGTLRLAKLTDGDLYLADLYPIAFNDIRTGTIVFKGTTYYRAILGDNDLANNDAVAVFFIDGKFDQFRATAGVDDNSSNSTDFYKFLVFVDGTKHSEVDLKRGDNINMTVDVTGADEVRVEIRCPDTAAGRAGGYYAGFAEARLIP